MSARKDHIHIYERRRGKGGVNHTYRCILPDCMTYYRAEDLIGKKTLCSICKDNELIISKEDIRRKHFRCMDCSNTKEAKAARRARDFAARLLGNTEIKETITDYDTAF